MCYHVSSNLTAKQIKTNFDADLIGREFKGSSFINGFGFPKLPIIIDEHPRQAILGDWGLIPHWATDKKGQKYTLNARIETIPEKASFKNSEEKRCLILVNGFYEWQWLDKKGNSYFISVPTMADTPLLWVGFTTNGSTKPPVNCSPPFLWLPPGPMP